MLEKCVNEFVNKGLAMLQELIDMVMDLQQQKRDLEDYLDQLLLRVMETSPRILQNPYMNCKTQAKIT
ncbi:hypothetical protein J6590_070083 [Homalodisca vitripennis]|nr:hypothetical protein J6590_070083 [Homalodisca vitripennis]